MKTKLFRILILVSFGLNIALLVNDNDEQLSDYKTKIVELEELNDELNDIISEYEAQASEQDSINIEQAAIQKHTDCKTTLNANVDDYQEMVEEDLVPDHAIMDDIEYQEETAKYYKAANTKISEFLEIKLGLSFDQINSYNKFKAKRTQEIDDFINERMSAQKESGNNSMILTMEDSIEIGKINQKYLERFKETIGPQAYSRYQDFKRELNQTMANDPNNRFPLIIEF